MTVVVGGQGARADNKDQHSYINYSQLTFK